HEEVLPNHDGTFQVSVGLNLTSVPPEDWTRYECVVQLKGIEDILVPLDPALIMTNWRGDGGISTPIIIGSVVLAVLLAAVVGICVGVFVRKRRNESAKQRLAGSDTSSEVPGEQNPAPEAQPLNTEVN
ncbi:hypothetical protein NHX12_014116, partial [Muraenolepis orangiensis]